MKVKIYSSDHCVSCRQVVAYFETKGVAFERIDVTHNREGFEEMVRLGGIATPLIVVGEMGKEQFEQFLATHPQLALKLLGVLSERLNEQAAMLEQLALGGIKDRVLYLLIKLSDRFGVEEGEFCRIDLPLTHQELANMIGSTRESVTVILNELIKEGVIQTGRMSVRIRKDRAKEYLDL